MNNHNSNPPNNTPTNKTLFKESVQHPPFNSFILLHHHSLPDNTSTVSNSTDKCIKSTQSLIQCNENFTITSNDNNSLVIVVPVNKLVEVIHSIKGDKRKI